MNFLKRLFSKNITADPNLKVESNVISYELKPTEIVKKSTLEFKNKNYNEAIKQYGSKFDDLSFYEITNELIKNNSQIVKLVTQLKNTPFPYQDLIDTLKKY